MYVAKKGNTDNSFTQAKLAPNINKVNTSLQDSPRYCRCKTARGEPKGFLISKKP